MADRNLYPHLRGRQAKQRIERERAEQAERDRKFAERFDERQIERHASDIAASINAKLTAEPDARVKALIERDKADQMREIERAAAEIELASGKSAFVKETVIEPTPEWFQHGDAENFTPEVPDRTAIVLSTVRRKSQSPWMRMLDAGQITPEIFAAAQSIAYVHERITRAGGLKSGSLQARVDQCRSNDSLIIERLSDVHDEIAYSAWRKGLPMPRAMFLDMVLSSRPLSTTAKNYRMGWRRARKLLIMQLEKYLEIREKIGRAIKPEDLERQLFLLNIDK